MPNYGRSLGSLMAYYTDVTVRTSRQCNSATGASPTQALMSLSRCCLCGPPRRQEIIGPSTTSSLLGRHD
ncbi:UNVERIFIED_CONTAM: hypothetical protein FKN15_032006 [Acipenser sinensis]